MRGSLGPLAVARVLGDSILQSIGPSLCLSSFDAIWGHAGGIIYLRP